MLIFRLVVKSDVLTLSPVDDADKPQGFLGDDSSSDIAYRHSLASNIANLSLYTIACIE